MKIKLIKEKMKNELINNNEKINKNIILIFLCFFKKKQFLFIKIFFIFQIILKLILKITIITILKNMFILH